MRGALPVLYEKNLRSALPQITLAPRGCFIFCVGRSEAVRARIEDELGARLGAGKALVRGTLAGNRADLWRVMTRARDASGAAPENTVLSYRLGEADARDANRLGRFNVGREARVLDRLRLLLWFDGFEQLDAFRDGAPDLWVFRSDVQFYLSHEDFEVPEPEGEVEGLEARIADIDSLLARPTLPEERRASILAEKAIILTVQGRAEDGRPLIEEAEQLQQQAEVDSRPLGRKERTEIFAARCGMLAFTGRNGEARALATAAVTRAIKDEDALLGYFASSELAKSWVDAGNATEGMAAYNEELHSLDTLCREHDEYYFFAASSLAYCAALWSDMGMLSAADACLDRAEQQVALAPEADGRTIDAQGTMAGVRGALAGTRGRVIEDLAWGHKSCAHYLKIQAWYSVGRGLARVTNSYDGLGLFDEARLIVEQALDRFSRVGRPSSRGDWQVHLGDLARTEGDFDEAARRYQAAVETYDSLRARASGPSLAATLAIASARVHGKSWPAILSPEAITTHREQAARLLNDVLGLPVSVEVQMDAHLDLGTLYRDWKRFDESTRHLTTYRDWARADQGPTRAARASIELVRTSLAREDAADALHHLAAAQADLNREEPPYRSRFVQKEILVATHEAQRKQGDLAAAHASLTEALAVVRAEGLRVAELDVIQLLAELPPAEGATDHRLAAAREAIAVATEVMSFSEEARALATLASLQLDAGRPDAARGALDEATWIAASVGPEPLRERIRAIARRLAVDGRSS